MDLKSCSHCGVVIDGDRLYFAPRGKWHDEEGVIRRHLVAVKPNKDLGAYVECPSCHQPIFEDS
jgi:hypothetical protein